ncbi:GGDEF domain-containing protein [Chthonobacter rhizosphaerae]|uniref:GGDEF domain-containing protein n=1 Tax=Chthonobacter rhizosphaerae TaxID=2735553 RepID=UPI0015EE9576|nr:GGDEF domain-containing protein [Chthonobacter rhizosphaerae]
MLQKTPPEPITLAMTETAIAGGARLLRFSSALEAAFERELGPERCRQMIWRGVLAIVLYNLFLVSDFFLAPDVFAEAVALRIGIVTPIGLAIVLLLRSNPPPLVREGLQAFITVVASATILAVMLMSESPYRFDLHYGIVLCILFATVVQRVRFWYAVVACLGSQLCYSIGVASLPELDMVQMLSANLVFGAAVAFSLVGSYNLEREQRLGYLHTVRERMRSRELEGLSRRDALTGLFNRRALEQAIAHYASMDPPPTGAILLLDIDHFKSFNDAAGHQAGDECLRRIASVIADDIRTRSDMAFRYGGEEFLILLHDTDRDTAVVVGDRVRRAIENADIAHPAFHPTAPVTVSVGVAAGPIVSAAAAEALIAQADAALYEAKRNGRNQVWPRYIEYVDCDPLELRDRLVG